VFSLDVELDAESKELCNRFTTLGQDPTPLDGGQNLGRRGVPPLSLLPLAANGSRKGLR
jgi:hypothetical protein